MSSRQVRTAVIPAAGLGTRFLPATKVIPKELLPVAGRPMIDFSVEEALASGIESIIVVLRKGKEAIAQHLDIDLALARARSRWAQTHSAGLTKWTGPGVDIRIAWQEEPRGLADAIRAARPLLGTEPFAVILPDALIDSDVPCTLQLIECHAKHPGCTVATKRVAAADVDRFGMLEVCGVDDHSGDDRTMRVKDLLERPKPGSMSLRFGVFGRYILEAEIFDCIDATPAGLNGELQLTDALMTFLSKAPVYAYEFEGAHYDAGNKLGFVEANIAFALHDPEIAPKLQRLLAAQAWGPVVPVV